MKDLAMLAEPQRFLAEALAEHGLDLDTVAEALKDVITDRTSDQRVAAIKLYIESTVGRAPNPTINKHLHLHGKSDKFFDPGTFSNTPPPKIGDK